MRNWTDAELESLYEVAGGKNGWLSKLQLTMNVSEEEAVYLTWIDKMERQTQDKIKAWEAEIENCGGKEIYFEENEGKQFVMLTRKINALEGQGDVAHLVASRYKLKYGMMRRIEPEAFESITEDQIERARLYPLWKLMGLDRPKNIACPLHKDRSPSFKVGVWGYCFSCHYWRDGIGWMMEKDLLSFSEAVKNLANR